MSCQIDIIKINNICIARKDDTMCKTNIDLSYLMDAVDNAQEITIPLLGTHQIYRVPVDDGKYTIEIKYDMYPYHTKVDMRLYEDENRIEEVELQAEVCADTGCYLRCVQRQADGTAHKGFATHMFVSLLYTIRVWEKTTGMTCHKIWGSLINDKSIPYYTKMDGCAMPCSNRRLRMVHPIDADDKDLQYDIY